MMMRLWRLVARSTEYGVWSLESGEQTGLPQCSPTPAFPLPDHDRDSTPEALSTSPRQLSGLSTLQSSMPRGMENPDEESETFRSRFLNFQVGGFRKGSHLGRGKDYQG